MKLLTKYMISLSQWENFFSFFVKRLLNTSVYLISQWSHLWRMYCTVFEKSWWGLKDILHSVRKVVMGFEGYTAQCSKSHDGVSNGIFEITYKLNNECLTYQQLRERTKEAFVSVLILHFVLDSLWNELEVWRGSRGFTSNFRGTQLRERLNSFYIFKISTTCIVAIT